MNIYLIDTTVNMHTCSVKKMFPDRIVMEYANMIANMFV